MGRHLQLWRMDFPPAIALTAEATRALLGDSLARDPGGAGAGGHRAPGARGALRPGARRRPRGPGARRARRAGQPAVSSLRQPVPARGARSARPGPSRSTRWSRLCRGSATPRWWLALGVALGAGLLAKFSAAFIGLALVLAVLVTPLRGVAPDAVAVARALVVALAIGSPSLVGQVRAGLPGAAADGGPAPGAARAGDAGRLPARPAAAGGRPRWSGSPGWSRSRRRRRLGAFRVVGWTCVGRLRHPAALHGKSYYAGPGVPGAARGRWRAAGARSADALGPSSAGARRWPSCSRWR